VTKVTVVPETEYPMEVASCGQMSPFKKICTEESDRGVLDRVKTKLDPFTVPVGVSCLYVGAGTPLYSLFPVEVSRV
jgi:hypothetical protein